MNQHTTKQNETTQQEQRTYLQHVLHKRQYAPQKVVRYVQLRVLTIPLVIVQTSLQRQDRTLQVVLVERQRLVDLEVEVMKRLQEQLRARGSAVTFVQLTQRLQRGLANLSVSHAVARAVE